MFEAPSRLAVVNVAARFVVVFELSRITSFSTLTFSGATNRTPSPSATFSVFVLNVFVALLVELARAAPSVDRLPPVTSMTSESTWIRAFCAKSLPPPTATVSDVSPVPMRRREGGQRCRVDGASRLADLDRQLAGAQAGRHDGDDRLARPAEDVERGIAEPDGAARAEAVVALDELRIRVRAVERAGSGPRSGRPPSGWPPT